MAAELRLDHVLVGVSELEAGRAEIERLTGVRPDAGGSHPQWGSHNALLALGPVCYLELVALRPESPPTGPFAALRGLERATPIGWAVATTDTARTRQRLEGAGFALTPTAPGRRERPDGSHLAWTTFGLADQPLVGAWPFFIEWVGGSAHPATDSPSGCSLSALRLKEVESERLRSLCVVLDLALEIQLSQAEAPSVGLILDTPAGRITLGG